MSLLDEIEAAIPGLRRYAHALMRDRDAAEDLVQDCLERALARRHHWRGDGPVRAWMFRILLNIHRDGVRRSQGRHLVAVETLPAEPSGPARQEAHMDLREVQAAIARLPADQRRALLLVALEGMSLAEAASILDIPEGTLVSRLGRARATLREMTGRAGPRPAKKEGRT
ncbi:sigma-70 family RNA polymerase sigma factor [Defluviimonas sp. WL0024]|uniref:Sigma-70 family RNA polymerase sigma factor n=1 Tax=Albidovulum salinarum TaxID=2984153 RepID=A0ABT2X6B3_9RHOB|nr:sigma-70 family RNA polymerase sigma factor [Defluviimonas sp. WL0024]MCU9847345.1 sigma-70 family RNA polymerase sigma factor [Defluviimonas sp. WL0024]